MDYQISIKCDNSSLFQKFSEFYLLHIQFMDEFLSPSNFFHYKQFHKFDRWRLCLFATYSVYGSISVHFPWKFSSFFNTV